MKSSKIMKCFEEYIKKFDMNNQESKAKYFHSLRSMDLAKDIATKLDIFTEEEILLIGLIALFHDLGEFDTKSTFESSDSPKEDNTMKTIDILFKEGIIRKILDDTKYDNVIKIAIYCHNKEGLPKNIDDKVIHICNILKDTYKIEELRMVIDYPYIDNRIDTYPSNTVYEEFKKMDLIDDKIVNNNADNILVVLSNVFCLNYRYSYYLLKENEYLSKITNSLIFADKKIEKFYKQLETILSNYINKKIMEK